MRKIDSETYGWSILSSFFTVLFASVGAGFLPLAHAQSTPSPSALAPRKVNATELIACSDQLMRGRTLDSESELIIITPGWTRKRSLRQYLQGYDNALVRILEPESERNIGSLRRGTDVWHYLPRAERVIKLAPSVMLQPWLGSDFTNDDLVKMSSLTRDYTHSIIGKENINSIPTAKLSLIPKENAPAVWGEIKLWIRKDCVPLKAEYYSDSKKLLRTLTYSDIQKVDDRIVPTTLTMDWAGRPGRSSILKLKTAKFNRSLPASTFTLRNLQVSAGTK